MAKGENSSPEWLPPDSDSDEDEYSAGPIKFHSNGLTLKQKVRRFLVQSSNTRIGNTVFDFVIKTLACVIYVVGVLLDDYSQYACHGSPCTVVPNNTNSSNSTEESQESPPEINWYVLLWVHRPLPLWIVQVLIAFICYLKAIILAYFSLKDKFLNRILCKTFFLETLCAVPFIITVCYPPLLKDLFVPVFFYCWLAKLALVKLFNDLHLTRRRFQTISVTLSQQLLILIVTMICLIFTTICGIQHIQRASSDQPLTMFQSLYFVIVTFSTVGYGDISPDQWPGQLFMIIMIGVSFAFIPKQAEVIASTWIERRKTGGEYSKGRAYKNKHVVVCSSVLTAESVMDFLSEFYAHPKLEEYMVILLTPVDLDTSMQTILKDPKWMHRVIYMRGSALKETDLKRCRMRQAEASFFLAPRHCEDRDKADHHTILRSWAVKDHAPECQQYIQLFKVENRMHVKFAEHVICEDEFKHALLANNCLYPGLSTLVTLLIHTSSGNEGEWTSEGWQQIYGRHSGNEIYHIQLKRSSFYSQYEGKKFSDASAGAHKTYGVCLVAVLDSCQSEPKLQLNPGPDYILKGEDYCFYMSLAREENSKIIKNPQKQENAKIKEPKDMVERKAQEIQKWLERDGNKEEEPNDSVFDTLTSLVGGKISEKINAGSSGSGDGEILSSVNHELDCFLQRSDAQKMCQQYDDMKLEESVIGPPPVTLFVSSKKTQCHILKEKKKFCCLKWGKDCEHASYKNANDKRWSHSLTIFVAKRAHPGLYNFIMPLRSHFISISSLTPIILLLEEQPDGIFLESIACFPMVYWMKGKITRVDDLLRAGINKASHLVVVNRDENKAGDHEGTLTDAETIVAVQTVFRLFPNANIMTELSLTNNMRFMHFQAHDVYSQSISSLEKNLEEKMRSNLSYIFRLPFAAGRVFSASMLDSLLYQTFVKGYLITFVRLLLGLDHEKESGHLSCVRVRKATLATFPSYGDLYSGLVKTTGEIPIAIYRTEKIASSSTTNGSANNGLQKSKEKPQRMHHTKKYIKKVSTMFHMGQKFRGDLLSQQEITDHIHSRMRSLKLSNIDYDALDCHKDTVSYVIVNPSPTRKLRHGDLIYVIQPSSMSAVPSKHQKARRNTWPGIDVEDSAAHPVLKHSLSVPSKRNRRLLSDQTNSHSSSVVEDADNNNEKPSLKDSKEKLIDGEHQQKLKDLEETCNDPDIMNVTIDKPSIGSMEVKFAPLSTVSGGEMEFSADDMTSDDDASLLLSRSAHSPGSVGSKTGRFQVITTPDI